jgi:hypothetical protein
MRRIHFLIGLTFLTVVLASATILPAQEKARPGEQDTEEFLKTFPGKVTVFLDTKLEFIPGAGLVDQLQKVKLRGVRTVVGKRFLWVGVDGIETLIDPARIIAIREERP